MRRKEERVGCIITLALILVCSIYSLAYGMEILNNTNEQDNVPTQVEETKTPAKTSTTKKKVKMYANETVNLRAKKSTKSKIKTVVPRGTKVYVLEKSKKWAYVKYDGKYGYIYKKYLSNKKPKDNKTYLGTFELTAYIPTGHKTSSGTTPTVGRTVAINGIAPGTKIYIDSDRVQSFTGSKYFIVEDTGGMPNNVIDVFVSSYSVACQFGRMKNVAVYIIK